MCCLFASTFWLFLSIYRSMNWFWKNRTIKRKKTLGSHIPNHGIMISSFRFIWLLHVCSLLSTISLLPSLSLFHSASELHLSWNRWKIHYGLMISVNMKQAILWWITSNQLIPLDIFSSLVTPPVSTTSSQQATTTPDINFTDPDQSDISSASFPTFPSIDGWLYFVPFQFPDDPNIFYFLS